MTTKTLEKINAIKKMYRDMGDKYVEPTIEEVIENAIDAFYISVRSLYREEMEK